MITEFCPTHSTYLRFPPSFSLLRPTSRPFLSLPLNALYWHLFFYLSHKLFSYLTPQMYHLIQAHIPVFLYAGLKHSSGRGGNQGKERGRNKKVEHRRGGRGGCRRATKLYTFLRAVYPVPWSPPPLRLTHSPARTHTPISSTSIPGPLLQWCPLFLRPTLHSTGNAVVGLFSPTLPHSLTHSLIYLFICSAVFTASGLLPDFVFLYE